MERGEKNIEQYMEDIAHIRALLEQNEERPVIRPWAFYVWGLVVIAASLISAYLLHAFGLDRHTIYFTVGIPGLLIGSMAEIRGLISQMRDDALPFFSIRMNRYYWSFLGIIISLLFFIYFLIDTDAPLAGLLIMGSTIPVFMYGLMSFSSLFFNGYIMLTLGFIALFIHPSDPLYLSLPAGILIGISYIIAGIQTHREVKRLDG